MNTKRKLNGFDLLLLIVVVLMIIGLAFKVAILQSGDGDSETEYTATYILSVTPVRTYTVDQLEIGDTIYYGSTDDEMGVITDMEVVSARSTTITNSGEVLTLTYEDRYEVILTIEATAQASDDYDGCYQVSGVTLLENRSDSYHTKYQSFSGTMLSVEVTES